MGLGGTVILIVVLALAAMALIATEICTPMFGLLAVLALGCAGVAVWLCFTINGVVGIVGTIVAILGLPVYSLAAVKYIPQTALGRAILLKREPVQQGEATPEADELARLVGRKTVADTVLRPSGMVRVDGRRIVAQAESGMIEKGQSVRIIKAGGNHVVVRRIDS